MGPGWLIPEALRDARHFRMRVLILLLPAWIISPSTMRGGSCRLGVGYWVWNHPFSPSTRIEGSGLTQELLMFRFIDQVRELVRILAINSSGGHGLAKICNC